MDLYFTEVLTYENVPFIMIHPNFVNFLKIEEILPTYYSLKD
jgi:hypothetical protein